MKIKYIEQLQSGDEVTWTDPDDGICSRTMVISSIEINGNIICIRDRDGNYLECFPSELS